MIKIVADSSTLYSREEAKQNHLDIRPLSVTINNKSYKELEELTTEGLVEMINEGYFPSSSQPSIGDVVEMYEKLVEMINEGYFPSSSQPSIGDVVEMYEKYPNEEIINISLADGLSGTYQSACMAKSMVDHEENITVINSKTLCGPHRYLVDVAVKLVEAGKTKSEVVSEIESLIETSTSFLIPKDFDYLVRGGRLSPLVGRIGGLVKLVPVMTLSEDSTRLEKFATKRTFKKAIQAICDDLIAKGVNDEYKIYISHACDEELAMETKDIIIKNIESIETEIQAICDDLIAKGVNDEYKIYISHACDEELAMETKDIIIKNIESIETEVMLLTPVFTAQGGPGCIAVQAIKKHDILK